jgi:tetratricopeptide (TPR) repeat protein
MKSRFATLAIVIAVVLAFAPAVFAAEQMSQFSDSGITVYYPPNYETQGKRILELLKPVIVPAIDVHQRTVSLLQDTDTLSKQIADALGAEEKADEAKTRLDAYKTKSQALIAAFTRIKLVPKADAVAAKLYKTGVLAFKYDENTDEFAFGLDLYNVDAAKLEQSYFPVFVNADGSIRSESRLPEMVANILGSNPGMIVAPIHDTVGYILAQELRLYYPFARWFNEGVSAWVTRHVVLKTDATLRDILNELFAVNKRSKTLKPKINLIAWPQAAYQNRNKEGFQPELEAAMSQYSLELIDSYFGKTAAKELPKVVAELRYNANADTQTICDTAKKLTGRDLKSKLLDYVPTEVRTGIESNTAKKLLAQAETAAQQKKWQDAANKIAKALQMTPEDFNARLNLAWLCRELKDNTEAEYQVFIAARLLKNDKYSVHLYASSLEGNYVIARLAILLGNLDTAKELLKPILEAMPSHADAKRAMEEVKAMETAAKGK